MKLAEEVADLGIIESNPLQDGRNMVMMLAPHKNPVKDEAADEPAASAAEAEVEAAPAAEPAAEPEPAAVAEPAEQTQE
jgi:translation initiation factor IF-3